jgi:xanthine/CO dehydrogenase XdhC/CoxF family maturation factor
MTTRSGRPAVRLDTSLESLLACIESSGATAYRGTATGATARAGTASGATAYRGTASAGTANGDTASEGTANGAAVLATVVGTAGSTYRKAGARMIIMGDGSYAGLLSGGCLEADLKLHALEVRTSGRARTIEYDMRGPDDILFGIGAGCEGAMRIVLEPLGQGSRAAAALAQAGRATRAGRAATLVVIHDSAELALGTHESATLSSPTLVHAAERSLAEAESRAAEDASDGRRTRAFVQFLAPPPHILLCGAGPDAEPVARTALTLGWRVTVVDHRPAYALPERFPGAMVQCVEARQLSMGVALDECHAVVVMSHHLPSDVAYLRALAEAGVPDYVGLLGPAARRRRIADELGAAADKLRRRIRGPVGIDIGAVTPEGIALAIVSEIHGWLADLR